MVSTWEEPRRHRHKPLALPQIKARVFSKKDRDTFDVSLFFYSFVAFNKIEINKNSLYMNYRIRLFFLSLCLFFGLGAWAQTSYGNIPETVDVNDATITKFGHATMSVEMKIVNNPVTNRVDTLRSVTNIEWNTEPGTAKQRMAERLLRKQQNVQPLEQHQPQVHHLQARR